MNFYFFDGTNPAETVFANVERNEKFKVIIFPEFIEQFSLNQ